MAPELDLGCRDFRFEARAVSPFFGCGTTILASRRLGQARGVRTLHARAAHQATAQRLADEGEIA